MPQSDFEDVLHTNYVPTTEETERILEFCAGPEAEIASLDLEIHRLEGLLAEAQQKRESLTAVVKSHRDLLAPIRRLSPELLQTIFAFCLPEERNTVMHASEAPLLLRRVSQRWRDIMNNTAEIWACIHIVVPARDGERSTALRHAAQSWLSRSGVHPLRISLYAEQNCEYAHIDKFLDILAPYAERWCHMSFTMPPMSFQYFERSPHTRHQLSRIRSLELRNRIRDESFFVPSFPDQDMDTVNPLYLLSLTPNITRICFAFDESYRPGPPNIPKFRASLAQSLAPNLQELTFDYPSMFNRRLSRLLAFLTDCHSLRRLILSGSFPENDPIEDNGPLVLLPKLEYLALALLLTSPTPNHEPLPVIFLDHIITPNLLELRLNKGYSIGSERFHATMTRFFLRSQCPLQAFMLEHQLHEMAPIASCLEHVPQLTKFSISLPYWVAPPPTPPGVALPPEIEAQPNPADGFLSSMCNTECCPNLTHLEIFNTGGFLNFELILALLRSRVEEKQRRIGPGQRFCLTLQAGSQIIYRSPFDTSAFDIPPEFRVAVANLQKEYPDCVQVVMPDPIISDSPSSYAGVTSSNIFRESWER